MSEQISGNDARQSAGAQINSPEVLALLVDNLVRIALSRENEVLLIVLPEGKGSKYANAVMEGALAFLPASLRAGITYLPKLPAEESVPKSVNAYDSAVLRDHANVIFCTRKEVEELKIYRVFNEMDLAHPSGRAGYYAKIVVQTDSLSHFLEQMEQQLDGSDGFTVDILNATAQIVKYGPKKSIPQNQNEAQDTRQRIPDSDQRNFRNYKTDGRPEQPGTDGRPVDTEIHRAAENTKRNAPPLQAGQLNPNSPRKSVPFWIVATSTVILMIALGVSVNLLYNTMIAKPPEEPTVQPVQQVIPTEAVSTPAEQSPAKEYPKQTKEAGTAAAPGPAQEAEPVITEAPVQIPKPTGGRTVKPTSVTEAKSTPNPEAFSATIVEKELINRYATVISTTVNFRQTPSKSGQFIRRIAKGEHVWIIRTIIASDTYEEWAEVNFDNKHGYIVLKYLNILSPEESENYDHHTKNTTAVPSSMYGATVATPTTKSVRQEVSSEDAHQAKNGLTERKNMQQLISQPPKRITPAPSYDPSKYHTPIRHYSSGSQP